MSESLPLKEIDKANERIDRLDLLARSNLTRLDQETLELQEGFKQLSKKVDENRKKERRDRLAWLGGVVALGALSCIALAAWINSLGPSIPVGTVMPFWGAIADIPAGFEICDGQNVTTAGSAILGKPKPNLRDTFLKGALGSVSDVRKSPETGGNNAKKITHHHGAGDLRALIGIPRQGSNIIFFQAAGGPFKATGEIAAAGGYTGPGDIPGFGVAVEGATKDETLEFDGRPQFVSLFFVIKVK